MPLLSDELHESFAAALAWENPDVLVLFVHIEVVKVIVRGADVRATRELMLDEWVAVCNRILELRGE